MWSYYGAKTNIVHCYPPPKHDRIIEPFAGTAKYALKYWEHDVLLIDKYPVIVDIWHYLQQCSPKDILSLPRSVKPGQTVNDFHFDCEAQKNLFSFIMSRGDQMPRIKAPDRTTIHKPKAVNTRIEFIAKNLFKIKHWQIKLGNYTMARNQPATWFVDPPYENGGQVYTFFLKKKDYPRLAAWCAGRKGQVIVCENTKAQWMNFKPMLTQRGSIRLAAAGTF